MELTQELVTPKMAEAWLNLNTNNRPLRDGVVEAYAADMKSGNWTTCPEPISFYGDGSLADGQHRLFAITESGCSIRFPVARGLHKRDGLNLNMGLGRTLVDNARISGTDPELTTALISTARAIAEGDVGTGRQTNAQKLEFVERFRGPAAWAVAVTPRVRYLCNAPIMAAVGRAYMVEKDHEKLKRFCVVMGKGFAEGSADSAAIAIRNYLLSRSSTTSSAANWRDTFLRVQNAISYFMKGKRLTISKSVADEVYPLPKAAKTKKAA